MAVKHLASCGFSHIKFILVSQTFVSIFRLFSFAFHFCCICCFSLLGVFSVACCCTYLYAIFAPSSAKLLLFSLHSICVFVSSFRVICRAVWRMLCLVFVRVTRAIYTHSLAHTDYFERFVCCCCCCASVIDGFCKRFCSKQNVVSPFF